MSATVTGTRCHNYPFIRAWNHVLGATSPEYIEGECLAAAKDAAPPDAVYRTTPPGSTPGEWITVAMIASAEQQQQVREYAQTLLDQPETPEAAPVRETDPGILPADPETQPEEPALPQHEFAISYIARLTGVVSAGTYEEALTMLVPPDLADQAGDTLLNLTGPDGVTWRAHFDSGTGKRETPASPPAEPRPASALRRLYDDKPKM
ncbi:hypothetical protein AB0M10_15135 [Streptomyces sp. NPDC051840]|uniref:hypothetical protein n=1 Tax=Streptomyces sp. NPDC051840 TaxID=3154752 RepID=UPI003422E869